MKKLLSLLLAFVMVMSIFVSVPLIDPNAATNLPNSIYITKGYSVTCTLASATMMLRARTYLSGNNGWSSITEDGLLPIAWTNGVGLNGSFTYSSTNISISVTNKSVSGGISINSLKSVLNSHPEGIVLYCGNVPHAVFLTDYEGDVFYCADPDDPWSGKRLTLDSSGLGYVLGSQGTILKNVTKYWYVSSYKITNNSSYKISYNANGGTGSIATSTVDFGKDFTLAKSGFTRTGYTLSGYNVYRASDKRWYTSGGWANAFEISSNGYTKKPYELGKTYNFNSSWTNGASAGDTFTFYAIWKQSAYNITYNANGGTGTMSASTIDSGGTLTIPECEYTREGYYFAGYNCYRKSDNTWYTNSTTKWVTNTDIYKNDYNKGLYTPGQKFNFSSEWTSGSSAGDTFIFHAIWYKEQPVTRFYKNYSMSNYVASSLDNIEVFEKNYISRDESIHKLSIDTIEKLNNQNSLKIVSTTAGSTSSKDFAISTTTNDGILEAGKSGDSRNFVMTFYAKSNVEGTKLNVRWGYSSDIKTVALTSQWAQYKITLPKTKYYGGYIHCYLDRAATIYMNNIVVAEQYSSSFLQEDGSEPIVMEYTPGEPITVLPELTRPGYTFVGWYTQKVGGEKIEHGTIASLYDIKLYAHWEKEFSRTPVSEFETPFGKRYEYYDNASSWEDAKKHCESLGGHLVTIDSEEENNIVYNFIKNSNRFAWIGASYNSNTSKWEWITGEDFEYTNWMEGEPSNSSEYPEIYAQIMPFNIGLHASEGKWNDANGGDGFFSHYGLQNASYVCEYELEMILVGDTDGDGDINVSDVTVIQRHLAQIASIDDERLGSADTNYDGTISIMDATLIQMFIAQLIPQL